LATAPPANSRRACAMSTLSVSTGIPTALTSVTARRRAPAECPGRESLNRRSHPRQTARRKDAQSVHFEKQRTVQDRLNRNHGRIEAFDVPTCRIRPFFFAAWSSASASARFTAIGFSTSTSSPISRSRPPTSACATVGTATLARPRARAIPLVSLRLASELCGDSGGTLGILVENANELYAIEFPVDSRVISPEFAGAHDGDTNPLELSRRRAHSFFIPFEASFGSGTES